MDEIDQSKKHQTDLNCNNKPLETMEDNTQSHTIRVILRGHYCAEMMHICRRSPELMLSSQHSSLSHTVVGSNNSSHNLVVKSFVNRPT